MGIPRYFPTWLFLYFTSLGTVALVLVALLFWTWLRTTRFSAGPLRSALAWMVAGFVFVLSAAWFACGVGAGPGFLLSTDASMHQPFLATAAAVAGMFSSVVGWVCLLVGFRKILKGLETGEIAQRG